MDLIAYVILNQSATIVSISMSDLWVSSKPGVSTKIMSCILISRDRNFMIWILEVYDSSS